MNLLNITEHINSYQKFPPEYGKLDLTNHLPMAQFALHRLGGSDTDMNRFTSNYISIHDLHDVAQVKSIAFNDKNWREHLGKREYFADYRTFFENELRERGRDSFLNIYFNALFPGISSAAYHSLIRLAYGVDSNNEEEILSGMAYLADSYLQLQGPLPPMSDRSPSLKDQMNLVSEKLSSGSLKLPPLEGIIFQKMSIVSQPEVLEGISRFIAIPIGSTLRNFADIAICLYLCSKDFTALHTVTSCHASRVMRPYVQDESLYLRYLYQALLAAYLTIDAPKIETYDTSLTISETVFERIKTAARKSDDDHDIKLTYTSLEEYEVYGNNLYLKAASELYPELELN